MEFERILQQIMDAAVQSNSSYSPQNIYRRNKNRCLKVIVGIALVVGFFYALLPEDSGWLTIIDIVCRIGFLLLVLLWCVYDSFERKSPITKKMSVCLFLLFGIAFPYYIFRTRGFKGGFKTLGLVLVFLIVVIAAVFIGGIIGLLPGLFQTGEPI